MIRLRQHIPNFVDGCESKQATADTITELLAVPWVASYGTDRGDASGFEEHFVTSWNNGAEVTTRERFASPLRKFFRWSTTNNGKTLMVEHNNGDEWWVVGYLESDAPVDLPEWTITPAGRDRVNRWNRGENV